jgi:threonine dehydratase
VTDGRRRPTAADIDAAADRIRGLVRRTPLVRSSWLSTVTGADVWLKLETSQDTGSFKIRGAMNAIACLKAAQPSVTTVMTASAGNHGLGLAMAARQFGLAARIHLPRTAPRAKRDGLARLGADLVEADNYDAAEASAQKERAAGATFVSAYSDPDVIAGAGTVALEILEDQPDIDTFVVPVGGGGMISGIALAVKARRSEARIVGAEAAASPVWRHALAAGRLVTVEVRETIADGLSGNIEPDSITFEIVRDLVERVIDVDEPSIASAMRELMSREQIRVEGSAAAAVGALLQPYEPLGLAGRKIAVVLSGSNVDQSPQ